MNTKLELLREQVLRAEAESKVMVIKGSGTKSFYGNHVALDEDVAVAIDATTLSGVVNYEPTELVITAWAGTPLQEIKDKLDAAGQMLAFDPPSFGSSATFGGCVAAGLSGPLRQGAGPLRDFVLGANLLDSRGQVLRFGGEVMKNVAGYDVSRLLAGSMGMFGLITQVSMKVAPKPLETVSLRFELDEQAALQMCHSLRAQALPVSATAFDQALFIRLAGAPSAVRSAFGKLGGERIDANEANLFWQLLREQESAFFKGDEPLWRIAVGPNTPPLNIGPTVFEWGGGQRWVKADLDAATVRQLAARADGHATLFHPKAGRAPADGVFQPLSPGVATIVRRLKQEFDPKGLFNPGRLVFGV